MTADSRDRIKQLEAYMRSLPEEGRQDLGAAAHQSEHGVFDLVKSGDAAGLYAALQRDSGLAERQDQNGMTPLHWSGIDKSGLLFEVLTQEACAALWTRDKSGRLPLDVMRDAGQHAVADKAERITYPLLFRDERAGPVEPKKVVAFERKYEAFGKPDTGPSYAQHLVPQEKVPQSRAKRPDRDERER
ncbi:hypothetical protein [Hyphobacterium indicum]|uniref:hypothetical protein n=1 Tax=Hyphobacterium indicum TaxID=2162714 RepID=UPI000D65A548|nr:hypothetical protein [Hyphobacterium indicum]